MSKQPITTATVRAVKRLVAQGRENAEIARIHGIHKATVTRIKMGRVKGSKPIYEQHGFVKEGGITYPPLNPPVITDRHVGRCKNCGAKGWQPCLGCQIKKRKQANGLVATGTGRGSG